MVGDARSKHPISVTRVQGPRNRRNSAGRPEPPPWTRVLRSPHGRADRLLLDRRAPPKPSWPPGEPSSPRRCGTSSEPDPLHAARAARADHRSRGAARAGAGGKWTAARSSCSRSSSTPGDVLRRTRPARWCPDPRHLRRAGGALVITLYGVCAVTFMMTMYTLERRGRIFILGFALGCVLSSVYGFLSGAWPFGVVELVWSASRCGVTPIRRTHYSELMHRARVGSTAAHGSAL